MIKTVRTLYKGQMHDGVEEDEDCFYIVTQTRASLQGFHYYPHWDIDRETRKEKVFMKKIANRLSKDTFIKGCLRGHRGIIELRKYRSHK